MRGRFPGALAAIASSAARAPCSTADGRRAGGRPGVGVHGQLVDDRVEVTGPAPLHDPGDGGVAAGQAGGALLVAQGLGDDGVGELHLSDALGVGLQQAGCDGRVEGVQDGLDRLVDDAGEHAEVDTPAEHGRGGQQLLGRGPELGDRVGARRRGRRRGSPASAAVPPSPVAGGRATISRMKNGWPPVRSWTWRATAARSGPAADPLLDVVRRRDLRGRCAPPASRAPRRTPTPTGAASPDCAP